MKETDPIKEYWNACFECKGRGKQSRKIRKKVKLRYQQELADFEKNNGGGIAPQPPKRNLVKCTHCHGIGIIKSDTPLKIDQENYPHIAIVGGGIGGVALAIACLHRGIRFTLYERDESFNSRSQGYGLTLQQASKAIEGLGISMLREGIVSTRHVVHNTEGKIIGEWGMRKWMQLENRKSPKRTNIHIARQSLRLELIEQLGGHSSIEWGHRLVNFTQTEEEGVIIQFEVGGELKTAKVDLLVGADGIRSTVRRLLIGDSITPLRYLDCIVILGICPLTDLGTIESPLLDSATVFQTANGHERIYMMPYNQDTIMWQLSFPMKETEAKKLSGLGASALKEEAIRRTKWHKPIPQIVKATKSEMISGYPVYDRELLNSDLFQKGNCITLIGDAAHPMSPFKGQGANQAILDALSLSRTIARTCQSSSQWRGSGIRESALNEYESEMLNRSKSKVQDSAQAAIFLHSDIVLRKSDRPRGKCLDTKSEE